MKSLSVYVPRCEAFYVCFLGVMLTSLVGPYSNVYMTYMDFFKGVSLLNLLKFCVKVGVSGICEDVYWV